MSKYLASKSADPKVAPGSRTRGRQKGRTPSRSRNAKIATGSIQAIADPQTAGRTTKQERVLTLLHRASGASIEEIMRATNWQQHSVRGFFAGTVKKKLGFNLVSGRKEGGVRRYRIEAMSKC